MAPRFGQGAFCCSLCPMANRRLAQRLHMTGVLGSLSSLEDSRDVAVSRLACPTWPDLGRPAESTVVSTMVQSLWVSYRFPTAPKQCVREGREETHDDGYQDPLAT